jgi:hypothetical protein
MTNMVATMKTHDIDANMLSHVLHEIVVCQLWGTIGSRSASSSLCHLPRVDPDRPEPMNINASLYFQGSRETCSVVKALGASKLIHRLRRLE